MDKHIPIRTCLTCRRQQAQSDFTRITRDHRTGDLVVDNPCVYGRSAYLCRSTECRLRLIRANGQPLMRGLKVPFNAVQALLILWEKRNTDVSSLQKM